MTRALRVVSIFAIIGVVVAVWLTTRSRSVRSPSKGSFTETIQSAISNPVSFAKARITGGVGVVVTADPTTGVPQIQKVLAGSPAEQAGLREGDHILQVDGVATSGQTLAQTVESIRGFAAGSVTLTVQRTGSTNLQCVIHRSSWKNLDIAR